MRACTRHSRSGIEALTDATNGSAPARSSTLDTTNWHFPAALRGRWTASWLVTPSLWRLPSASLSFAPISSGLATCLTPYSARPSVRHSPRSRSLGCSTSFKPWLHGAQKGPPQMGITIHSSRRRFAAQLNSRVRPWWSKCVGGCRFGEFAGVHAVGSGQQSSPLLVGVSSVLRLGTSFPRCARCSWLRWHHATLHRWASSIPQAVAHSVQAAVLGAWLHHPTFEATHCLTTHSSRSCFATRLNSGVRALW
ncbi:hypothetical protein XCM_13360 [Xanthomonas citri pv. mangiferaeindicae]|nr:hypothetical protein XCM_13360 [Xanthomonas citri pv. mangiferaeindicae]